MTTADLTWDAVIDYGRFAVWHDWTPEQVDALPFWYRRLLPTYHALLDQLEREERERSERSQTGSTSGWGR